jgi:quercetin dioxygenase-like cupin family protein
MNDIATLRIEQPQIISNGVSIMSIKGLRDDLEMPVSILEFTIEPYTESTLGANPVIEVFRILFGHGAIISEGREVHVRAGDWVLIKSNIPHQVRNESADVFRAISLSWAEQPA